MIETNLINREDGASEHRCRLYFEVLRWALEAPDFLASSRSLEKFLNLLGAEEFSFLWHQVRTLDRSELQIFRRAISSGQIESKLYLLSALRGVLPLRRYNICVVGGWLGILGRFLWWLAPELSGRIVLFDQDPVAIALARRLNIDLIEQKRLEVLVSDANTFDYDHDFHLIINTSCEHFTADTWFARIPKGRLLALQASDSSLDADHLAPVSTIKQFRQRFPLELSLYKGVLPLNDSQRFTMIGRK